MATLRSTIETNVAKYLNRAGDTTITDIVGTWFSFAHKEIQRRHNFKCMEKTFVINLVSGTNSYSYPTNFKEARYAYTYNTALAKIVNFYDLTEIQNLDHERNLNSSVVLDPTEEPIELRLFACFESLIEIYPDVDGTIADYDFRMRGWNFLSLPATNASDWFTDNAEDYLLYRCLLESVPYIGQTPDRIAAWTTALERAFAQILGHDVQTKHSGKLYIRG